MSAPLYFGTDTAALADRLQHQMDNQPLTQMRLIDAALLREVVNTLRTLTPPPAERRTET
jgi:hypothetical protein